MAFSFTRKTIFEVLILIAGAAIAAIGKEQGSPLLLGLGVGLFFLRTDALAFVGSILAGLGIGLFVTAIISSKK